MFKKCNIAAKTFSYTFRNLITTIHMVSKHKLLLALVSGRTADV